MPLTTTPQPAPSWESAAISALLIAVARRLNDEPRLAGSAASYDSVTGLLSRGALEEQGAALFAAARGRRATVSVMLVDVDRLSEINRGFGAAAGDAVLAHVAHLIGMNIQPGVDLAGRLAGATMILVLPEADFAWAGNFAERLRGTLANRPLRCGDQMIEASACFGVASTLDTDRDFGDLVRRATHALAAAKIGGPNLVRVSIDQELAA